MPWICVPAAASKLPVGRAHQTLPTFSHDVRRSFLHALKLSITQSLELVYQYNMKKHTYATCCGPRGDELALVQHPGKGAHINNHDKSFLCEV